MLWGYNTMWDKEMTWECSKTETQNTCYPQVIPNFKTYNLWTCAIYDTVLNLEIKKQICCKKYQPYIPTSVKINNLQNRNDMDLANQIGKRSKMGSK